jgi:lipopolysaccharide transport protein LptA
VLGLYFVGGPMAISIGDGTLGLDAISLSAENLKMSNPVYEGYTDDNGRYVVRAVSATQQLAKRDLVALQTVTAKLTDADGDTAEMAAATGEIDTKKEIVQLGGGIAVKSSDGLKAKLNTAVLYLKSKRIVSKDPVAVEMPSGTVKSERMEIFTEEKRVLFSKDVEATLVPPKKAESEPPMTTSGFASAAAFGDRPIVIQSDVLDIRDTEKTALFSGKVRGRQDGSRFTAPVMRVTYTGGSGVGDDTAEGSSTATEIVKISSEGGVVITTDDGRTARSNSSLYDRLANTVTLRGSVLLVDDGNRIEGEQLEVDLENGVSRFLPGARVKGVFGAAAKRANGQTNEKKVAASQSGSLGDITSFSADDDGPTTIESNSLEVHDTKGLALFRGNVVANRGNQQIKAEKLDVSYVSSASVKLPEGQDSIRSIVAEGHVVVSAPDDRVVTGDKLVYDAKSGLITVTGNVTTSQGKNVIKGDKLVIDLETGQSSFDTVDDNAVQGVKKRIKMLIDPNEVPKPAN